MFAGPAAGSDAALAAVEEGVGVAYLELALQGLIALGDAQRESVRIEEQFSIFQVAARRGVGIANHEMPAGVRLRISPHALLWRTVIISQPFIDSWAFRVLSAPAKPGPRSITL